jgi:diguanylate cyclase (GGDEF)-like protein
MSFRARLTTFFLLIVIVPMIGVGFVVLRLISDSQAGKADARAAGLVSAARSLYVAQSQLARDEAVALARQTGLFSKRRLRRRLTSLLASSGLVRIQVSRDGRLLAQVGARGAIAPGSARIVDAANAADDETVTVSVLTASVYGHDLSGPGVGVVVRQGSRLLYAEPPIARALSLAGTQTVRLRGASYRSVTQTLPGFSAPVRVSVLSAVSLTSASVGASRAVAIGFIVGFLLLAGAFAVLSSRALEGQLRRFLAAARRLASGDFSAPVVVEGRDDFALLGQEFNNMAAQLQSRLDDLSRERERLRELVGRIGKTFESNLDRTTLLELAMRTAMDAVGAERGRLSARSAGTDPLREWLRVGPLEDLHGEVIEAERMALASRDLGSSSRGDLSVVAVALAPLEPDGATEGLITVVRSGRAFERSELDLLRSLAGQASLALENVRLHEQVSRQAVTDDLTGLANHGCFQKLLARELEQVRRYHHPVGLIMLDLDDFKTINDTYGHQQGDVVLREIGRVLAENCREVDAPARYGGEELAVILPHTGLDGAHAIAERIRREIERLRIPRLDGMGTLSVTASLGVAATDSGAERELIAEADAALYAAKRAGKNRSVCARALAANVAVEG